MSKPAGMSRKDAAAYLGITTRTLDKMCATGELRRAKFGAKTIIPTAELDRLLEEKLQPASESK